MEQFGRWLIVVGLASVVVGAIVWGVARLTGGRWRGLPGDLAFEGERWAVYVPLGTMLVLSLVLTLLWWLWTWINRG